MTRRRILSIALLVFALSAVATVSFVVYRGVTGLRRDRLIRFTLQDVDSLISRNNYLDAGRLLDDFLSVPLPEDRWLPILRRAYLVRRELPGWTGYRDLAVAAAGAYRRNASFQALALRAQYRAGESPPAESVPEGSRFDSLRALLLLASEDSDSATSLQEEGAASVLGAVRSTGIESLDAAYRETGVPGFLVNAALLHLDRGESVQAAEILQELPDRAVSPRLRGEAALSARRYGEALSVLDNAGPTGSAGAGGSSAGGAAASLTPAVTARLRGDALMGLGRYADAVGSYRRLDESRWSAESYQNLAYYMRVRGDDPKNALERGHAAHPEDPALARALALELSDTRPEEAAELLEPFLDRPEVALTELVALDRPATVTRVRGSLRRLYNDTRADAVGHYLAWYLAGLEDWNELRRLVEDGEGDWALFYGAVLDLRGGELSAAREGFAALRDHADFAGAAAYNEALLVMAAGEDERALALLQGARERLTGSLPGEDRDRRLSRVLEGVGRIHLLKGREETGYRMLSQSLEYDPGNVSARNRLETR